MSFNALLVASHVTNVVVFSFSMYHVFNLNIPMLAEMYSKYDPGQLRYLTLWNMIVQALFFLICLLNDFFGTNAINPKKTPFMRKFKDYIHASLGFPVAMFVGIIFWGLMFLNRELVFPKVLDPYFPWWLNHSLHTLIMVSTLLEMIIAPRQYPKRSCGLGILVNFMLAYLIWVHVIYYKSGVWVYPVMGVLSQPLRIVFFAVLLAFCTILYFIGEALNNFVWGNEYTKHKNSYAKSK